MASFKTFLQTRRKTDTPIGDFIGDALRSSDFPEISTLAELNAYLKNHRAVPEAFTAARTIWKRYLRDQAKEGTMQ